MHQMSYLSAEWLPGIESVFSDFFANNEEINVKITGNNRDRDRDNTIRVNGCRKRNES